MQILVLGMHRSGTSAITRLIHMMGAWLGDEQDIMPAHEYDNPQGYWERLAVYNAHDNLLHALNPSIAAHCSWIFIANFNAERLATVPGEMIDPLRAELAILDAHRPWVMKDPRLCLLLPVWQTLLSEPVYVLMHRHPLEVARSLANRVDQPLPVGFGFSLALWEKHILSALRALHGKRVLVVSHQRLLAEPWQQCQRLHAYLQTSAPSLQLPSREHVEAFVSPRLYHYHREAAPDALWLTAQQKAIDEELEHYAAQPGAITMATPPRSMPDAKLAEYEQLELPRLTLPEQQQQLQSKDALMSQQQTQLRVNSELAVQQQAQLQSMQEQIQQQQQQSQAKDALISRQQAQLRMNNEMVVQQQAQLQSMQEQIQQQQQQLRANQDLLSQLQQVKSDLESALQNASDHFQAEQSQHQGLQESMRAVTRDHQQLLQLNAGLRQQAGQLNQSLAAMRASWSWRLTRPLRYVLAVLRKEH